MSKIKTEYYFEMLKPEIMKLLGSTQRKITRDKNCLDVAQMKFTEVALVYCNISIINVTMFQKFYIHFSPISDWVGYFIFHHIIFAQKHFFQSSHN